MSAPVSIVWFRLDLRLADHPALLAAVQRGAVLPVFIHAPEEESPFQPGAASCWWLHQSLEALASSLRRMGSRLILRRGPTLPALVALARESGATAVFWNRRYEPGIAARDARIETALREAGLETGGFPGALLREPGTLQNQSGKPFQVFTPFWKQCLRQPEPDAPLAAARRLAKPKRWPQSVKLDALELEPKINWTTGLRAAWQPGEAGARFQLERFLDAAYSKYATDRNRPDLDGTSRLSPHLHFGEITPRLIWHAVASRAQSLGIADWRESQFLTEIGWREFSHHLLHHFPHTPSEPLRPDFKRFPWREDAAFLRAWQTGKTGYPIVDAGMRELWATGWMHNRVRMIVGSFLVKDLLVSWIHGAAWFWDTLVDADLAQNTLGWQWTAGCGADAAPYFRVFNPVSQGTKFDPKGEYVRKWCPELSRVPLPWLHEPGSAPAEMLERAGVRLGDTYPEPLVSHAIARSVALTAFATLKRRAG